KTDKNGLSPKAAPSAQGQAASPEHAAFFYRSKARAAAGANSQEGAPAVETAATRRARGSKHFRDQEPDRQKMRHIDGRSRKPEPQDEACHATFDCDSPRVPADRATSCSHRVAIR